METFLRCVKMGYDQDLAVIELNGLKIAEDRTFADCARYVFGSILDLCLPAPRHTKDEYQSLYDKTAPDVSTQVCWLHGSAAPVQLCTALGHHPQGLASGATCMLKTHDT